MLLILNPQVKRPSYALESRLEGLQIKFRYCGVEENVLLLQGAKPSCPAYGTDRLASSGLEYCVCVYTTFV
jgi:hypothetical protein